MLPLHHFYTLPLTYSHKFRIHHCWNAFSEKKNIYIYNPRLNFMKQILLFNKIRFHINPTTFNQWIFTSRSMHLVHIWTILHNNWGKNCLPSPLSSKMNCEAWYIYIWDSPYKLRLWGPWMSYTCIYILNRSSRNNFSLGVRYNCICTNCPLRVLLRFYPPPPQKKKSMRLINVSGPCVILHKVHQFWENKHRLII